MKVYFLALVCFFSIGILEAQEAEFNRLLAMQNKSAIAHHDLLDQENYLNCFSDENEKEEFSDQPQIRVETNNVQMILYGESNFHVADYADGTRVVTCLDGTDKGLQGIAHCGVLKAQSSDVQWNDGHFVHFYPYGTITSFPNKQQIELHG